MRAWTKVAQYLFLGFVYLNILLPVLFILMYSLNEARFFVLPVQGWSLKWYVQALTGGRFLEGLAVSLEVAIAATILSAVTGTLASIALVRAGIPGANAISQLLLSPLIIPAIPLGLGLLILFTQVSVVTGYRFAGTYWSLVVGHAVIAMPWVMRLTIAGLQVADRTLEEAAANLGASPLRTYWHVTLPLLRPGIVAGSIFAFVTSFSEVNMSLFLVGPQMTTLPISILNYVGFRTDPSVAAISSVVILITTGVILAADRIVGLNNVY